MLSPAKVAKKLQLNEGTLVVDPATKKLTT